MLNALRNAEPRYGFALFQCFSRLFLSAQRALITFKRPRMVSVKTSMPKSMGPRIQAHAFLAIAKVLGARLEV